jgi:Domain of unknown function (DUF222)/HNH endonuclease
MNAGTVVSTQVPESAWDVVCGHAKALFAALDILDVRLLSAAQRLECLTLATRMENIGHARAVATLAVAESAGDAVTLGAGTTTALVATRVGWAPGRIRSALAAAGVFAEHPEIATAGCAGDLSSAHTLEITRGLQAAEGLAQQPAPIIARDLLCTALTKPLSELRAHVRDLKYSIDPWRAEDDLAHARERSYAKFVATRTGMVRLEALLDPERGALVRTAIEGTVTQWLRHNALDPTSAEHVTNGIAADSNADDQTDKQFASRADAEAVLPTTGQLAAQALTDVTSHYLSCGVLESTAGVKPHLVVTVPAATLHRAATRGAGGGPDVVLDLRDRDMTAIDSSLSAAQLAIEAAGPSTDEQAGDQPTPVTLAGMEDRPGVTQYGAALPANVVERIACEAEITVVTTGPGGQPLALQRASRMASPAQRTALAVRDRHCRYPGCDRPAAWCVAHHIRPWAAGGNTDLENLVLLCQEHHTQVHADRWTFTRTPDGSYTATPQPP